MDNQLSKKIEVLGNTFAAKSDHLSKARINKSDFDKTYIGTAVEKVGEDKDAYWLILTDGASYKVTADKCNITAVGQKVRLFVPNHRYQDKYAEVIDDTIGTHPTKVVYNNEKNTITETWNLADKTEEQRVFTLTIENKDTPDEEVTAITFPDGSVMTLEGFVIG